MKLRPTCLFIAISIFAACTHPQSTETPQTSQTSQITQNDITYVAYTELPNARVCKYDPNDPKAVKYYETALERSSRDADTETDADNTKESQHVL